MQIKETIIRECCQDRDIQKTGENRAVCIHCGKAYIKKTFTDPAGDTDWEWIPARSVTESSP